ncbi:DUF58 domain-containing protein [Virgibacillus halodenitrificans]|uniref:DUF58 domain-containing protein n=1 Tax=Virgibacillus halodenitrificans TaxID=1482 RepID=UPI001367B064|nr:DUF58 domain-containing protein [Virgibacillus halodenitrificans]MYL44316.1 DUF58 domain-containing protein [Virgibacillus halodenitrificans]
MDWEKIKTGNTENVTGILFTIAAALLIISMVANKPLTLMVVGFIVAYAICIWQYSKQLGNKLKLINSSQTLRLFPGEKAEVRLIIKNESPIPYFNGQLIFYTNEKVVNQEFLYNTRSEENKYLIPFILRGNRQKIFCIPFEAKQRGIANLHGLQLAFPHMLQFGKVYLKYNKRVKTDIIIYPEIEPVYGIKEISSYRFGEQQAAFSPFENLLNPRGIRDYLCSDPFHRIHWKASAKKQQLQVKEFEPVRNISWSIVINTARISPVGNLYINERLEQFISQAAFISLNLIEQGFPVEIYFTSAISNQLPRHLPMGEGRKHLKKVMEFLARFNEQARLLPVKSVFHLLDHRESSLIILIGEDSADMNYFQAKWRKQDKHMFYVHQGENGAYLTRVKKEGP